MSLPVLSKHSPAASSIVPPSTRCFSSDSTSTSIVCPPLTMSETLGWNFEKAARPCSPEWIDGGPPLTPALSPPRGEGEETLASGLRGGEAECDALSIHGEYKCAS